MSTIKSWMARAGVAVALVTSGLVQAAPITVDFEQFADFEVLDSQLSSQGLTFSKAFVLRDDVSSPSLDSLEFPPHSGASVMVNDGGAIAVNFATDVRSVSFYATYDNGVVVEAFDRQGVLLGSVLSSGTDNRGFSVPGAQPNEQLSFVAASADIAYLMIGGNAGGGFVVVDDLTVDFVSGGGTAPEPQSLALVLAALAAAAVAARRRA